MVWLSIRPGLLYPRHALHVSIPIWSDYLFFFMFQIINLILKFLFQYGLIIYFGFIFLIFTILMFLFQYGLIIYRKTKKIFVFNWICFYSNMVWLSIDNLKEGYKTLNKFLFQYGLIIYLFNRIRIFKDEFSFYSNMVWLSMVVLWF